VVVDLWTDQGQRLSPGTELSSPSGTLRVASSRPTGHERFLVHFEGVADRAAAERLRGVELSAEALEVPGTLWVHELVGTSVRDAATGAVLGTVAAIEANPASDLLVLESGGLIPLRFVTTHDAAAATVEVEIPEGLLDL
jgi:16S rRNA processing protein RimM